MTEVKKIVLFDGLCNLCSRSVQFILKHDNKDQFLFASLQGKAGMEYLQKFNLPADTFNSFLLIDQQKLYTRSSAVLHMLKHLGNGWELLYVFILVPKFIRDGIYNIVAKNRYKWFGKKDTCWIPSAKVKAKFLD
jgi:predicted DCC family thiol-disulfide oxidoreductase YuxK